MLEPMCISQGERATGAVSAGGGASCCGYDVIGGSGGYDGGSGTCYGVDGNRAGCGAYKGYGCNE